MQTSLDKERKLGSDDVGQQLRAKSKYPIFLPSWHMVGLAFSALLKVRCDHVTCLSLLGKSLKSKGAVRVLPCPVSVTEKAPAEMKSARSRAPQ